MYFFGLFTPFSGRAAIQFFFFSISVCMRNAPCFSIGIWMNFEAPDITYVISGASKFIQIPMEKHGAFLIQTEIEKKKN